jgi:hypothetical protein
MGLFDLITTALSALGSKRADEKRDTKAEPEKEDKEESVKYQAYLDERKSLVEGERKSAEQFDTTLVALSGSALGVSIVFIEKIAPKPIPWTITLLCLAWGAFVLSLLAILASFLTSQYAYCRQRQILGDELLPDDNTCLDRRNKWAIATRCLNWTSIGVFIVGACLLVAFSVINIKNAAQSEPTRATLTTNAPTIK